MNRDHHARVKELFLAAREQPPAARTAFLADLCADNIELQKEVESLLLRLPNLDEAAGGSSHLRDVEAPTPLFPGRIDTPLRVANYRILQKIGEGGMGEVYEAEQQNPVRRRVALKVLKGGLATREVIARFESERQALALMNHANIAQVFEAGMTERASPFFAMELVHGEPITQYCDRHRLTNRDRLDLFEKVCAGVQHAHQKGIIHRDLKPSNILVTVADDEPVPKIIDFGIAKATSHRLTESTLFTQIGQWIGTPEYMSPEQAEMSGLDIDTRSDVYSLGVLLYELLAGARPFEAAELKVAHLDEMRRRIREDEPTRPSTRVSGRGEESVVAAHDRQTDVSGLIQQLRGDLDWITLKALEKDRTRRYASPSELAADIHRHLSDEPVSACPPSALYKLSKFVRRNRLGVFTASLVAGALLLGLIVSSLALHHAQNEANRANQVADFLEEMIGGINPFYHRAGVTPEVLLEQAVSRLETELAGQSLVQARLMRRIGIAYRDLDSFDRSRRLLERSREIFEAEYGHDHLEVANSLNELAFLAWEIGDYQRHRQFCEEQMSILSKLVDADDPLLILGEFNLAFSHWTLGQYPQASEILSRSLVVLEHAYGPNNLHVARAFFLQGVVHNATGDYRRGGEALERSLRIRTANLGPKSLHVAWTLRILARNQRLQGHYPGALEFAERALDLMAAGLGADHSDLAFPLETLGATYAEMGRFDEAWPLLERAVALREAALGPDHPELGISLIKLAWAHLEAADPVLAEPLIERSLAIARGSLPPEHPRIAWRLHTLSRQRLLSGKLEEALSLERQALAIAEVAGRLWEPSLAAHLANLGVILRELGSLDEAQSTLERAVRLRQQQLGPEHRHIADDLLELAMLHDLSGNEKLARREMQRALEMYKSTVGDQHPAVARCLQAMKALPTR